MVKASHSPSVLVALFWIVPAIFLMSPIFQHPDGLDEPLV